MGRRSGCSGGATGSLARSGIATPPAWAPARENSHKLAQTVRTAFAEQSPSHPPAAYFELASAALRGGAELKQMAIESLVGVLEQRLHAEMRELWLKLGFAVAGVVLLVYLSLSFYFSFAGAVRQLHRGVDKVLGGDLSARIEIEGRDELAEIGGMVERMNERLSTLVAEIRSSAVRVSMSGEVVASGSQALAGRTEQQAASLRQAVVTVQHLSSAVAANAAEASELDRLTAALRSEAEVGGEQMRASVDAMAQLEDSSRRVAEIIGVIDSVAFRTNILALNAAVEAARAGALSESVATIRLRQGSADEARALVERAHDLLGRQGLGGAAAALHSREQGFVDRDLYVFVVDRAGRYVLHGPKPAMEGKRVHEVPGIDGDRFVRDAWAAAASHGGAGGWAEYDIVNPETGKVQPKASFVRQIDERHLVGCGIYRVQAAA